MCVCVCVYRRSAPVVMEKEQEKCENIQLRVQQISDVAITELSVAFASRRYLFFCIGTNFPRVNETEPLPLCTALISLPEFHPDPCGKSTRTIRLLGQIFTIFVFIIQLEDIQNLLCK